MTKNYTAKVYADLITKFFNEPILVKSLVYTTEEDPMALPESFENLVESWKKCNVDVDDRVWENSRHARLLKTHSEEYEKCIINFLQQVSQSKKDQDFNSKL